MHSVICNRVALPSVSSLEQSVSQRLSRIAPFLQSRVNHLLTITFIIIIMTDAPSDTTKAHPHRGPRFPKLGNQNKVRYLLRFSAVLELNYLTPKLRQKSNRYLTALYRQPVATHVLTPCLTPPMSTTLGTPALKTFPQIWVNQHAEHRPRYRVSLPSCCLRLILILSHLCGRIQAHKS